MVWHASQTHISRYGEVTNLQQAKHYLSSYVIFVCNEQRRLEELVCTASNVIFAL